MTMKEHILAALREQLEQWDALLAGMSDEQITDPLEPSEWTIKDVLAHLMAWQQRSNARLEAAFHGQSPVFPEWLPGLDSDDEGFTDQVNAWIYQVYTDQPWVTIQQAWRDGFLRLLESSRKISEMELLDSSRYPWMGGYPLANVLLGTYDHHQEHYEKLHAWRARQANEYI